MSRKFDIENLRWVRLFTSAHIPTYLVEQINNKDFETNSLYLHFDRNLLKRSQDGPTLNPLFHVWALVDTENLVKGFLWFTIDPLTQDMIIQTYSVDSNYWNKGAVEKLAKHMKSLRKKADLKKIYWITDKPKHSEKHGFKRSKSVLMEYNDDEGEKDGKDITRSDGDAGSAETGAA